MIPTELDERRQNIRVLRSIAIEGYAGLEHALCSLFASLLGTSGDKAAIIFFKLSNFRARNVILEELLEFAFSATYDTYFYGKIPSKNKQKGLFDLINYLDAIRNEIVHWSAVSSYSITDPVIGPISSEHLSPPHRLYTHHRESGPLPQLTTEILEDFYEKARFASSSVIMFNRIHFVDPHLRSPSLDAWRQIFLQPCVYPPLDTHPLSPNYREPDTPPPP